MKASKLKIGLLIVILLSVSVYVVSCSCEPKGQLSEREMLRRREINDVIGKRLDEYMYLEPLHDDFGVEAYGAWIYDEKARLPAYEIIIDEEALDSAASQLIEKYDLKREDAKTRDPNVVFYRNGDQKLRVNRSTGRLQFKDLSLAFKGYDKGFPLGKEFDRKPLLTAAQDHFEKYIPKEILNQTYFLDFSGYVLSTVEGEEEPTHIVSQIEVVINPTVDEIPIVGAGGKYSLEMQPDGTLVSFDFQYARFEKLDIEESELETGHMFDTMLDERLKNDQRDRKNYIYFPSFGYSYQSYQGKVKYLIPTVIYKLFPNEGITDTPQVYAFVAAKSEKFRELYQEDVDAELARKAKKYENAKPDDIKEY